MKKNRNGVLTSMLVGGPGESSKGKGGSGKKRKPIFSFILVILGATLVGGLMGFFFVRKGEGILERKEEFITGVHALYHWFFPWGYGIFTVGIVGVSYFLFRSLKRKYLLTRDGDYEEMERWEERLESLIFAMEVFSLFNIFLFFSAIMVLLEEIQSGFTPILVFFVASDFVALFIERGIVLAFREVNPEKKGDPLDVRFQKNWVESCDEAQKAEIYRCGYSGYLWGLYGGYVLFILSFILHNLFAVGLLPLTFVTIHIFVMQIGYFREKFKRR